MTLNKKQRKFVNEYLQCFNATEAARRAGYSSKTARSIGAENLTKPDIAAEIEKAFSESAMSADEVLMRLAEQARGEYSQYISPGGRVDLDSLISDGKSHLIKGVKETKYGLQIEFYDSQSALITMAKHHGLLVDRVDKRSTNIEVDLNTLTDDQIKRLAAGEDIASIMANE